jgi:hypothetical protein
MECVERHCYSVLYLVLAYGLFGNAFYDPSSSPCKPNGYLKIDWVSVLANWKAVPSDWDRDVVTKLLELQQSGQYRIAIHGQMSDALVVAQRITQGKFSRGPL